jgi:hypothetical protein
MRYKAKGLEIFFFPTKPKLNPGYERRETLKLSYSPNRSPAGYFFSFPVI